MSKYTPVEFGSRLKEAGLLPSMGSVADAYDNSNLAESFLSTLKRELIHRYSWQIEFEDGWGLEELVEDLNRRVFFWPGWEHKLIEHGLNHFKRYRAECPAILRLRFDSLRRHNQEHTPLFCKFNSGSPRSYLGRHSPRGPATFLPAHECPYAPGTISRGHLPRLGDSATRHRGF